MEGEEEDIYNLRMSDLLADWGEIHIFVFFFEYEGESNINQSASMEFEKLANSRCVVIYFEDGSYRQMKTRIKGHVKKSGFDHDIFKEIEEIFDDALAFCLNCL